MLVVPRLLCSSRSARAFSAFSRKAPANVSYSTIATNYGYALSPRRVPTLIKYPVDTLKFYSNVAVTKPTEQKKTANDETGAEIIYTGKFKSRVLRVKLFSFSTSIMGVSATPILLQKSSELGGTALATVAGFMCAVFTFLTPMLLHFITKKYVIQITHNPATDEYVATTISFFLMKNEVWGRLGDCTMFLLIAFTVHCRSNSKWMTCMCPISTECSHHFVLDHGKFRCWWKCPNSLIHTITLVSWATTNQSNLNWNRTKTQYTLTVQLMRKRNEFDAAQLVFAWQRRHDIKWKIN